MVSQCISIRFTVNLQPLPKRMENQNSSFRLASFSNSMSPQPSTAASVSSTASSEGKEKKSSWLSRSKHSVLSSLSSNTTTTVQAVRRTKEEKSGKAHDLEPAESINKSVSSVPATLERVFLGAVKDDWPLYS